MAIAGQSFSCRIVCITLLAVASERYGNAKTILLKANIAMCTRLGYSSFYASFLRTLWKGRALILNVLSSMLVIE
jgi:hypothetical protein